MFAPSSEPTTNELSTARQKKKVRPLTLPTTSTLSLNQRLQLCIFSIDSFEAHFVATTRLQFHLTTSEVNTRANNFIPNVVSRPFQYFNVQFSHRRNETKWTSKCSELSCNEVNPKFTLVTRELNFHLFSYKFHKVHSSEHYSFDEMYYVDWDNNKMIKI